MEFSTQKLSKDLKYASATLTADEARFLVDTYYQMQDQRIGTAGQIRSIDQAPERELKEKFTALAENYSTLFGCSIKEAKEKLTADGSYEKLVASLKPAEPHETLTFFMNNFQYMEDDLKKALEVYAKAQPIGRWMMSIKGIGPVIAAGLMAHIDIKKAPTAGHIWNYAGLNPEIEWGKGQKRPFNAKLKVLCWKIGESFVKQSNREGDIYGHIYAERKALETAKNERGEYADQAKAKLEKFRIGKNTEAYKWYSRGMLPPAHINARAKRYAVKMFLSHLQQVWWEIETGEKPAKPFAIAILEHAHMVEPPNWH